MSGASPVITPAELELLGRASALLESIADRATAAAWGAGTRYTDTPTAQNLGRLAGVATVTADALFDVANVAQNYVELLGSIETFNSGAARYRRQLGDVTESPGHSVRA